MQGDSVIYSGVWDRNIEDQMWSCHFGKSLEQVSAINMALQMSEEGSYMLTRISKVSRGSRVLYTCIWKVPLDFFDFEEVDAEGNEDCDGTIIRRKV